MIVKARHVPVAGLNIGICAGRFSRYALTG